MMGKAALVVGLGIGYVLGTRDGRARYEQIKAQADRLWSDPKVQEKAAQAQELAKQKAPELQEKVTGAAHRAGSRIQRNDDGPAASTSPEGTTSPAFAADGDR